MVIDIHCISIGMYAKYDLILTYVDLPYTAIVHRLYHMCKNVLLVLSVPLPISGLLKICTMVSLDWMRMIYGKRLLTVTIICLPYYLCPL